jgi:hypothetical protein
LTLATLIETAGPEGPTSAAVNKSSGGGVTRSQDADFPSIGQNRL